MWVEHRHFMTSVVDEDERPVALLVHNSEEVAIVIREWRLRFLRESLDAAESCVLGTPDQFSVPGKRKSNTYLDDNFTGEVVDNRVVVSGVNYQWDSSGGHVCCKFIEEAGGSDIIYENQSTLV